MTHSSGVAVRSEGGELYEALRGESDETARRGNETKSGNCIFSFVSACFSVFYIMKLVR